MEEKVNKEVATKEVNAWLDIMDISKENRETDEVKTFINSLISSVQKGLLFFNDDETVTQKLIHPLNDGQRKEISYDFRYEVGKYNKATKGISSLDSIDWSIARLSLSSVEDLPKAVFEKMKRADFNVAKALTIFF